MKFFLHNEKRSIFKETNKQTNEQKKKKKDRKKENSHALLSHARKAMVLSTVPNAFYHLAGLI